ncbi:polyprenyl synthetase family protein [Oceanobacillus sp. Castelsardo]|uniref:polyprenyl synthetase family protein n=1 Tax=Oceanobacillus sp. Castelsardo TaxID=1851204 RepID=UPI000839A7F8|nr:farnesyl diphosphate synthase [Oceanobacillus sp. Castelsardo]
MSEKINAYINRYRKIVDEELVQHIESLPIPEQLKQSMLYSVEAGGKRLRPVLLIASFESFADEFNRALSSCIALELIHTYSLIHDDLPAMDDDDYRRGKPTNHKVFDEATAILAGDALLTYSFELIAQDPLLNNNQKVEIIKMLSATSGPKGMVAGQILDMEAETRQVKIEELENIHALKTGKLLEFAMSAGGYLGGASESQLQHLKQFAYYLGLIFQVQDDILDVTGDQEKLGKPVGSDENNHKSTYPKLLGLDGAMDKKKDYVEKAYLELENAGARSAVLKDLTHYFSNRDH